MNQASLAEALGLPARMIRYLVAERIVGPATATGRGAAGFGPGHLEEGRRYLALAASQPDGRIAPRLARALLGYPHGRAPSDRVPVEVDLGVFAALADVERLAVVDEAGIETALSNLRTWLLAIRAETLATTGAGGAPTTPTEKD